MARVCFTGKLIFKPTEANPIKRQEFQSGQQHACRLIKVNLEFRKTVPFSGRFSSWKLEMLQVLSSTKIK
jgi:hypothetical protein